MSKSVELAQSFDEVETLSELLRIGKDEMNLAEFPMTSLSDRPANGETSLKFEDQIYDDRKKKLVPRKRIIEGSKEYGLPTATDDSVILALIQLTKLKNGFTAREVEFTRRELINLLSWPNKGQSYDRIALSLHRLAGVTYHFENSWWDNRRKSWNTKIFGIIDTVELNDSRETDGQSGLFPSRIEWNQVIFDSFQAGYLRSLDFQLCMRLKHSISMRIYRFMGKRFHFKTEWSFNLKDFAYEHIGLSRTYEGGTQIARKLQPALNELEAVGFLEPLTESQRFSKKGREWSIRLIPKSPALPDAASVPEREPPPLVAELTKRGVTPATAVDLVQQHPAELIERQLEYFDWLMAKKAKKIGEPGGYLFDAIRKDYAAPKDFISRAERERQAESMQKRQQADAAARRRQQETEANDRAERQRINAYWESLTAEQQAELQAAADAQADPADLAAETGPLKRMGQMIRRHAYIRQLLQAAGKLPPAER